MRKPNGYGSIKKLSGNRGRPFVFVVSESGRQKPVAYFTNQIDAEIFQADYNKIHRHRSLPGHQITLSEVTSPDMWLARIGQNVPKTPLISLLTTKLIRDMPELVKPLSHGYY